VIGRTISHYRVLEKLGEGGMGVVYKAEDTTLGRLVALKFLSRLALGMSHEKARLVREAKAAASLDHPNICTVYEAGEVDGETFIAMALVDGGTLSEKVAEGPLTVDEAMDLAKQIAEGLAAAHKKGIVHRDVKPGNVMITSEGKAKIVDFGLAMSPGCTRLTRTGATVGTVAYMSPEQTQGAGVDHRSDIWSFGVMLFEMLTGRRPFEGGHDQAVIHSILNDEPSSVSELRPDVPDGLDRVTAGALIKNPDERYQSIEDVLEDLRSIGTVGTTATIPLRAPRPARAHGVAALFTQWRAQLVAAATVIAVGVAGMAIYEALVGDGPAYTAAQGPERVVVVPFENRTGDPSLDHIGESASESICAGLTQAGHVQVVTCPTEGAESDPGSAAQLLRSARDAGATVLVAGSFKVESDALNMEARLLDVSDGAVLNAIADETGALATPAEAITKTRSRVMGALAARAEPWILRDELTHAPTWEAYRAFAEGLQATTWRSALPHYERAVDLDPAFKPATRRSYTCRVQIARIEGRPATADSLVDSALAQPGYLSPNAKLFVQAREATHRGDYSEALRRSREFARVEPEFPESKKLYSRSALRVNHPRESVDYSRRLLDEAHESGEQADRWVYWHLLIGYHMLGEFELQLALAEEALELFPDDMDFSQRRIAALAGLGRVEEIDRIIEDISAMPVGQEPGGTHFFLGTRLFSTKFKAIEELDAHGYSAEAAVRADDLVEWQRSRMVTATDTVWARWSMAWALYRAERLEDALAAFERLEQLPEENMDMVTQCIIGVLAGRLGDRERALEIKQALLDWDLTSKFYHLGVNKYFAGSVSAALGERDDAMDLLLQAIAEGNDIWDTIHYDLDYKPMWDYPPFKRLLEPKG
jgi:tetratricopeptide (TPR) repeat protein